MSFNSDNRQRIFAEVVSIQAWHNSFNSKVSKADLLVDVVFGEARIGGELVSPIRFKLELRCAELIVVVPETEPVSVDLSSVSRDAPLRKGRLTETVEHSRKADIKGGSSVSAGAAGISASAKVEADAQAHIQTRTKRAISSDLQTMEVTQSLTPDGQYRWLLKPVTGQSLQGRPWRASKHPRLKLIDKRKDRSKGIPPTVHVEIRCRREDLLIRDIEMKDENLFKSIRSKAGFGNKIAAAESYIRDRLAAEGLEVQNIRDPFGRVTLASVTAVAQ
jgi:hypothetical protein